MPALKYWDGSAWQTITGGNMSVTSGPAASRPTAGVAGRFYWNTTIGQLDYDTGAAWQSATIPTVGTLPAANLYDGQRVTWVPAPSAFGTGAPGWASWSMMYLTSNSRWWFVGGDDQESIQLPTWNWTPGTAAAIVYWGTGATAGPTITIPNTGEWMFRVPLIGGRLSSGAITGAVETFNFGLTRGAAWASRQEYTLVDAWSPIAVAADHRGSFVVGDLVRGAVAYVGGTGHKYEVQFEPQTSPDITVRFHPITVAA